jgi:hypothetical protein
VLPHVASQEMSGKIFIVVLSPARFGPNEIAATRDDLPSHIFSTQWQQLSLSEIKSEHSDDVIRRELVSGSSRRALPKLFDIHGCNVSKTYVEIDGGRRLSRLSIHG